MKYNDFANILKKELAAFATRMDKLAQTVEEYPYDRDRNYGLMTTTSDMEIYFKVTAKPKGAPIINVTENKGILEGESIK